MPKISIYATDPATGEENEFFIPAVWDICPRCKGDGHHSNPSIDGNGITAEEFSEWDYEDRMIYLQGGYDVKCYNNCSDGKVLVPDDYQCFKWQINAWEEQQSEQRLAQFEIEREHKMLGEW